jgi:hypothetical protein
MMKNIYPFLFSALLGLSNHLSAQAPNWQWAQSTGGYPDEIISSVVTDASGNIYVTGGFGGYLGTTITIGGTSITSTNGADNVFVAKLNPSGSAVWVKNFGGATYTDGHGIGKGVAVDGSGNVYVTGVYYGTAFPFGSTTLASTDTVTYSVGEIFITKLDNSGNPVWAKSAGGKQGDIPYAIAVDNSGNAYITGLFCSKDISFGSTTLNSPNNTNYPSPYDMFVAKYNSSGAVQWAKNYGGSDNDGPNSIAVDAAGNVIIAGTFQSPALSFGSQTITAAAYFNMFYVKLDASGNEQWAKTGTGGYTYAYGVSTDAGNNIYLTGTYSAASFSIGSASASSSSSGYNYYIAKCDPSGDGVWIRNTTTVGNSYGLGIDTDPAGNSVATGYFTDQYMIFNGNDTLTNFNTSGYNEDVFLAKYDASGNLTFIQSAGGQYRDMPSSVSIDPFGNTILTGTYKSPTMAFGGLSVTNSYVSYDDIYIAKMGNATGIEENADNLQVTLFPNPSNGIFHISSAEKELNVRIMDTTGKTIRSEKMKGTELTIDLSAQPKGLYFLQLMTDKKSVVKKVVLE